MTWQAGSPDPHAAVPRPPLIKICGLTDPAAVDGALDAGADLIGLVFFPPSPRHLSLETGAMLAERARGRSQIVALTVNAEPDLLDQIAETVRPTIVQFHGRENVETVMATRSRLGLPVMKAVGVAGPADLDLVDAYRGVADHILLDAKPPKDATRPGGNGLAFDWSLLAALDRELPFMLSGGLTPETVSDAVKVVRPWAVDVSSGVESAPGQKDISRMADFVRSVRQASQDMAAV